MFYFETMKIDLFGIRIRYDLRRYQFLKNEQWKENELMKREFRRQIGKFDEWLNYLDGLERREMRLILSK